ncbi:four-helix bundle copper-binding protein [Undibacterium umbellatum]|jgi:hypothetical protein|uniref:Four-helix bundle copper-binding protein n=2 Tax=Undibacterium TaxID=401469 RepID=A0ABR6ZHW2_9BURK|nr:four-helix bundle copper-binding protein [Undibacterium umbellatum]MBC3911318.1 four-helix bundle copper-binding protein [Undibacterium umbellatum]
MKLTPLNAKMEQCLANCLACHRICTAAAAHVMHGDSHHSEVLHLVSLLDCAQICLVHADFMARRSPHHSHLARECAEICLSCASFCEAHSDADGMMTECAKACRTCADSCTGM